MTKRIAFRAVHPDFRSRNGFVWPFPGRIARAPGPIVKSNKGGCPSSQGDGICLATTAAGMATGQIPAITVLVCEYDEADVLGQESSGFKLRVSKAKVLRVVDFPATLRGDFPADPALPTKADLSGANLNGANLSRANLNGADLSRADIYGADLYGADLRGASLANANLSGANLYGADIYGADIRGASFSSNWKIGPDGIVVPA